MNISEIMLEIVVGRLVLGLPKEDLEKINKMIIESVKEKKKNASIQQEDNATNGLSGT